MSGKMSRRAFIKRGAGLGAASILGGSGLAGTGCSGARVRGPAVPVDIAAAKGDDAHAQTRKAVELLGGMKRYVPAGARVGILPNAQRNNPGTFTSPDIVRAVIEMCREAGAAEVTCATWLPARCWDSTGLGGAIREAGARLEIVDMKDESLFEPVPVPRGVVLEEARIMKLFFEYDIFINIPITKDHAGNRFTGTLKNLMGLNSPKSNRTFHTGNFENDDIRHLDQCIADLNTIVAPALCVVDATEFIITNGPFGPGKLHRPGKVVAGTDRVAMDAYCASLWGLEPSEIIMIDRAYEHGLGEIDLARKKIHEAVI